MFLVVLSVAVLLFCVGWGIWCFWFYCLCFAFCFEFVLDFYFDECVGLGFALFYCFILSVGLRILILGYAICFVLRFVLGCCSAIGWGGVANLLLFCFVLFVIIALCFISFDVFWVDVELLGLFNCVWFWVDADYVVLCYLVYDWFFG